MKPRELCLWSLVLLAAAGIHFWPGEEVVVVPFSGDEPLFSFDFSGRVDRPVIEPLPLPLRPREETALNAKPRKPRARLVGVVQGPGGTMARVLDGDGKSFTWNIGQERGGWKALEVTARGLKLGKGGTYRWIRW